MFFFVFSIFVFVYKEYILNSYLFDWNLSWNCSARRVMRDEILVISVIFAFDDRRYELYPGRITHWNERYRCMGKLCQKLPSELAPILVYLLIVGVTYKLYKV